MDMCEEAERNLSVCQPKRERERNRNTQRERDRKMGREERDRQTHPSEIPEEHTGHTCLKVGSTQRRDPVAATNCHTNFL